MMFLGIMVTVERGLHSDHKISGLNSNKENSQKSGHSNQKHQQREILNIQAAFSSRSGVEEAVACSSSTHSVLLISRNEGGYQVMSDFHKQSQKYAKFKKSFSTRLIPF